VTFSDKKLAPIDFKVGHRYSWYRGNPEDGFIVTKVVEDGCYITLLRPNDNGFIFFSDVKVMSAYEVILSSLEKELL
jgi:hypothetical protein